MSSANALIEIPTMNLDMYDKIKTKKCNQPFEFSLILKARTVLEVIVLLYACGLILLHFNEIYVQRLQFIENLLSNPTRILYLLALIFIILIVPLRVTCNTYGEDILVVLIIIFISVNTMYFAR